MSTSEYAKLFAMNTVKTLIEKSEINVKVNGENIPVGFNTATLASMGYSIGAAIYTNAKHCIILDSIFYKNKRVAMETKAFFLLHEIGHIRFSHVKEAYENSIDMFQKRISSMKHNKVIPQELEADKYAYKIIGYDASINALKYLKRLVIYNYIIGTIFTIGLWKELPNIALSIKEIENRIKAIKSYEMKNNDKG